MIIWLLCHMRVFCCTFSISVNHLAISYYLIKCYFFFCSKKYLSNKDVAEKLSKENSEGKVSHYIQRSFLTSLNALLQCNFSLCYGCLVQHTWFMKKQTSILDLPNYFDVKMLKQPFLSMKGCFLVHSKLLSISHLLGTVTTL